MKRKLLLILGLVALIVSFSSCSGNKKVATVRNFSELGFTMADYQKLGQTTVTVESRTYLGFIHFVDKVNDEIYNARESKVVRIEGMMEVSSMYKDINKAIYKVLEEYPDADYLKPTIVEEDFNKLFLGRYTKTTMVIKAYKLND